MSGEELLLLLLGSMVVFSIFFILIGIVAYILGAIGLMKLADQSGVNNGWLAFIPVANLWVVGETIRDRVMEPFNKHTGLWYLGATIALWLLEMIPYIGILFLLTQAVIVIYVCYQLFAKFSEKAVLLTILSVISLGLLWGFFLFAIRNNPIRKQEPAATIETTDQI
ncbi:hypothetical protein [Desertibacillus haloalkaliphilus]|uniref:hypothetical protein n=1 Tax=Desertibacillus haloalkaliphilus TaxID=1328930 RepID=UPI001C27E7B3|nr:hypothetical protein [Desertibacillus haloalkaliphilus]MBU8906485.1 hypothetical protein [Desertibacillus haloalkaliphilus]